MTNYKLTWKRDLKIPIQLVSYSTQVYGNIHATQITLVQNLFERKTFLELYQLQEKLYFGQAYGCLGMLQTQEMLGGQPWGH